MKLCANRFLICVSLCVCRQNRIKMPIIWRVLGWAAWQGVMWVPKQLPHQTHIYIHTPTYRVAFSRASKQLCFQSAHYNPLWFSLSGSRFYCSFTEVTFFLLQLDWSQAFSIFMAGLMWALLLCSWHERLQTPLPPPEEWLKPNLKRLQRIQLPYEPV